MPLREHCSAHSVAPQALPAVVSISGELSRRHRHDLQQSPLSSVDGDWRAGRQLQCAARSSKPSQAAIISALLVVQHNVRSAAASGDSMGRVWLPHARTWFAEKPAIGFTRTAWCGCCGNTPIPNTALQLRPHRCRSILRTAVHEGVPRGGERARRLGPTRSAAVSAPARSCSKQRTVQRAGRADLKQQSVG